ncbi:hypothetical protein Fleli_0150 [Bernardetia litoralis DSM 6794]|uniref:Lipoprotein n=1 Tax=Bernardetia litoralis (strain ATCC 23117 / DSM 6794 / NBRC 15988 / NCIMB 1366 / Fx l1 / Sio-4) TaxID=880071 RepID=I4AFB4_BERLS|nr:hypothetical protein [Bernardetia litoralis]AFM02649.1 hypothetical protein Fleli_0150 [Bernardetia litoralis DSM 6794]
MKILNIYLVISILILALFISCKQSNEKKYFATPHKIFRGDTTISDTTIINDYLLYNILGYGKKHFYIESLEARKHDMYREDRLYYDNVLCKQDEYKGEKAPIGYNKVFVSNIKTNTQTLSEIIRKNEYVILSGICLSDSTNEIVIDSIKHISINSKIKMRKPLSFKHVEKMQLSIFEDTINFIHNSSIDTLNLSISSGLKLLDFKNTKINVLNISYSPNIDLVSLKKNDLIKSIIVYDDKKDKFIIVK